MVPHAEAYEWGVGATIVVGRCDQTESWLDDGLAGGGGWWVLGVGYPDTELPPQLGAGTESVPHFSHHDWPV